MGALAPVIPALEAVAAIGGAASALGLGGGNKGSAPPQAPAPQIIQAPPVPAAAAPTPAAAAPTARRDTGATVVIGADAVKNKRLSGNTTKKKNTTPTSIDVLGGLGGGGLNL